MSDTPSTDAAILRTVNIYIPREDGTKRMVFELVEAAVSRQLERDLSAAKAECEALRRDAERYLWLRSHEWGSPIVQLGYDDYEHLMHEQLDAAIDAARAKEGK